MGTALDVVARREFSTAYIWLDVAFLLVFAGLLLWRRRYMTAIVGLVMGVVYFGVDYGIFNLLTHSRSITGGSMFWVLLWMSMSYGFTNFSWLWLWLSKDRHLAQWTTLILLWWFSCPLTARAVAPDAHTIVIQRTTGAYHGWMAMILFVGYFALIVYDLAQGTGRRGGGRDREANIPWLLAAGILVQFAWEAALLVGGIRSAGMSFGEAARTLTVDSLLETNLGMPYVYVIFLALTARYTESLHRREHPLTLGERLEENNRTPMPWRCR